MRNQIHFLFLPVLLPLSLLASIVTSQAVVYAPLPPQASTSTDVVGFILQNPTNESLPAQHIVFGHPFGFGQLRTAASSVVLLATGASSSVPVQVSVKATHRDGSVKHAVLVAQQPTIAADTSLPLMLTTDSPSNVGFIVDLNDFPSSTVFVSLSITRPATQSLTVDVSQALKDALSSNSVSYFFQGPLATQARVVLPVVSSFRMALDVTLFSDQTYSVDVQFLNDIAMSPIGGTVVYDATITANGATVYSALNLTHYQYQTWHHVYHSNQEPRVNVQYDILGLIQANVIHPYNYTNGLSETVVNDAKNNLKSPEWGKPFADYGVTKYMPMTGGRADIGPVPLWTAAWIVSQNDYLRQHVLGWAEAAGSAPFNYFAKNQSRWLNVFDYPNFWLDTRCKGFTVCPTQWTEETTWNLDGAHLPSLAYVPYLITGSRYYLDRMEAVASWTATAAWYALRNLYGPTELGLLYGQQLRGAAWGLREIVLASYISPDDTPMREYYDKMMFNHMSWLNNQTAEWQSQTGEVYGVMLAFDYRNGWEFLVPPWQSDFFASTLSIASRQGNALASQYLTWSRNWDVGRFTHAPAFNPRNGIAYKLYYGNGTNPVYYVQTWAELQHEQVSRGLDLVDFSGSGGYFGPLGLMTVILHQIEDPSDSDAVTAFDYLKSAGVPNISPNDFRNDPTFSMAVYPTRFNTPSVVAGRPVASAPPSSTNKPSPALVSSSFAVRVNVFLATLFLVQAML